MDALALTDIAPLLRSGDELVREEAVKIFGELGVLQPDEAGPILLPLLSDPEMLVRNEAVEAFGPLGFPPAVLPLLEILRADPAWIVRASAAEALGGYSGNQVTVALEGVVRDIDEETAVRMFAVSSLGRQSGPDGLAPVEVLIEQSDSEPLVAVALRAAAYRLGGQRHLAPFLEALSNAERDDALRLLNEVQDWAGHPAPPTLSDDLPYIEAELRVIAARFPIAAIQVQRILDRLAQPGTGRPRGCC
ncbi:HEAT repeat domain-containing protein [Nocardia sp. NPDC051832]|uniref:HEAT repeat domain-containing protein n=1 Tax=Nocardia sp. NPDC051832 TaxID=3155673 RepID=UPI00342A53EB